MASDGSPGQIPGVSLLQGSQAISSIGRSSGGKILPQGGSPAPAAAQPAHRGAAAKAATPAQSPAATQGTAGAQALTALLNRHLNDTGRPDQFRVDPTSSDKLIQEINPANGAVVGEYPIDEFPALARSIGASGQLVDDLA